MSDVGKLCYKAGGTALCYKAGGSALCYKAVAPTDISLTLAFRPQTWVCYTYDSQHAGILNVNTLWDGANYSVTSSPYTITIPASYCKNGVSALQLTIATSDVCQAHEDPGVSVAFAATQNGTTINSAFIASPLGRNGASKTITISLQGGIVSSITEQGS